MPVTEDQLDDVAQEWNKYAEERPRKIRPRDLLEKRDPTMYRGLGITSAMELAQTLVEHRSVATMEMTLGFLYERLFQVLGPTKVTTAQKALPGYKGLDFVQPTSKLLRLINLKSGLSTSNGDISLATKQHLQTARDYWESQPEADDNPLGRHKREVEMVRAVARGSRRRTITPEGIVWLVGDATWRYFGAGDNFLQRLNEALGRNPLDYARYEEEKGKTTARVIAYLQQGGFIRQGGQPDWNALIARYP